MLSKANIKLINSLEKKKYRKIHNLFIIEGERLVHEAVIYNFKIKQLFLTGSFLNNQGNSDTINLISKNNITSEIIPDSKMKSISETVTPSGIFALCEIPLQNEFTEDSTDNYLFLDDIQDPGNMGTLLRSASWFGIKNVALSGNCIDIYNPKVVRSGMGAHFNLNIYTEQSLNNFSEHTKLGAFQEGKDIYQINGKSLEPWVLVIGSEAHGISAENSKIIDKKITIPKIGNGESLNAAIAGSLLLYHLTAPLLSD